MMKNVIVKVIAKHLLSSCVDVYAPVRFNNI